MSAERSSLPPGPNIDSVSQLLRYSHKPLPFLEGCARHYGDPFTVRMAGYGTLIMLTGADAMVSGPGMTVIHASVPNHKTLSLLTGFLPTASVW